MLPYIVNFDSLRISEVSYQTELSAGFDIPSNENYTLKPGEFKVIKTNLKLLVPDDNCKFIELQIRSRSGLAAKHGVCVLNSPGTIDLDYKGEIGVILINHSKIDFQIKIGDRIAQGVFCPIIKNPHINIINKIRGDGGFGST
jgi:dUTP pyrophosphatase